MNMKCIEYDTLHCFSRVSRRFIRFSRRFIRCACGSAHSAPLGYRQYCMRWVALLASRVASFASRVASFASRVASFASRVASFAAPAAPLIPLRSVYIARSVARSVARFTSLGLRHAYARSTGVSPPYNFSRNSAISRFISLTSFTSSANSGV